MRRGKKELTRDEIIDILIVKMKRLGKLRDETERKQESYRNEIEQLYQAIGILNKLQEVL